MNAICVPEMLPLSPTIQKWPTFKMNAMCAKMLPLSPTTVYANIQNECNVCQDATFVPDYCIRQHSK